MRLAGVDLAWQSEKNPTAIAYGTLTGHKLQVTSIEPAVYGIDTIFSLLEKRDLHGVAIDASLIINNSEGQRPCETHIARLYGSRGAACHSSNTRLYPDAKSVYLSLRLLSAGFNHIRGDRWQIECYPHPSIIEMFNLPRRLQYKKGRVVEKRSDQKQLASLLKKLGQSPVLELVLDNKTDEIVNESSIDSLRGRALKSNEDAMDALICLYIAGLYAIGHEGHLCGDTESGYIWIPTGNCI